MSLAFFVYLASIAEGLAHLLVYSGIILLLALFFVTFFNFLEDRGTENKKWFIIPAAVMLLIGSLIPSEKAMYMMAGAYAAQTIYESPSAQRISGKIIDLIDEKLSEENKNVKEKK